MRLGSIWQRRFWRDESGAGAVEFSIVGSLLIGILLVVLQFGWALQVRNDLAQAADRGIRLVSLDKTVSDAAVVNAVKTELSDYDQTRLAVNAGAETVNAKQFRTVTVSYQLSIFVPGRSLNVLTLSASRETPIF